VRGVQLVGSRHCSLSSKESPERSGLPRPAAAVRPRLLVDLRAWTMTQACRLRATRTWTGDRELTKIHAALELSLTLR